MWSRVRSFMIVVAASCGASQPQSPAAAPNEQPTASGANQSTRPLTPSECQGIVERIVATCDNISGTHSAEIDGWCTDIRDRTGDTSWASNDCAKHARYVDYVCFMSDTSIGSLMACDSGMDRTSSSIP
jgi:hypothetical protein